MRILIGLTFLVALSFGFVACSDDDGDDNGDVEPTTAQVAEEDTTIPSQLDLPTDDGPPPTDAEETTTDSGLIIIDLSVGDGAEVPAVATVNVYYSGWLEDGTVFDSAVERGEPISFPLNGVIAGWTEGIPGMKVGGTRRLIIPSELAYGETGSGDDIPPNSTLTFDIELIAIE